MQYTLSLSDQETQAILEALAEQRYRIAQPVIERIIVQVREQAAPPPIEPTDQPPKPARRRRAKVSVTR